MELKTEDTRAKLFVGQVPPSTSEEELRSLFEPFGEILEIVLLKDKVTGARKGCAFVAYANRESADQAIAALDGKHTLPGAKKDIAVRYAGERPEEEQQEVKVYVGMLSHQSAEEDIRALFEPYGIVTEVHLMRNKDTNTSKGSAFVKYQNRQEAERAVLALNGRHRDKNAPGMLQVRFAHTPTEKSLLQTRAMMNAAPILQQQSPYSMYAMANPLLVPSTVASTQKTWQDPYGMYAQTQMSVPTLSSPSSETRGPPGANLFIYNVPDSLSDQELYNMFAVFGRPLSAKVFRDKITKMSKGYGFVSYDNAQSAAAAIAQMDGVTIGAKKLNVRLKKGEEGLGMANARFKPY